MLRRFTRHAGGAAAVEFAFIAPIMLILYFGMTEATQALLANRRAGAVTTAVGDLVAQSAQISAADVDSIFDASTAIMKPFPTGNLAIRVTSIQIDENKVITKKWTRPRGTIAETSLSDIDPKLKVANTSILRAETIYTLNTPFNQILPKSFVFKHRMDLRPRSGAAIPLL